MPTISFKKEFIPKILSGDKKQTIRAEGKRIYESGQKLYFYSGRYTKKDRVKFGEAIIQNVLPIRIVLSLYRPDVLSILLEEGFVIHEPESLLQFIKDDGFDNQESFYDFFFKEATECSDGLYFHGRLITWVDFEEVF